MNATPDPGPGAGPNIAVLHEWVDAYAGSEQVFEAIARAFPSADLFALSYEPKISLELGGREVKTTFLDHPALRTRRSLTLPIMPLAWRALGKAKYDVVISSHHSFAHANRLADEGVHLCYVHSPARYLWTPEIDGRGNGWYLAAVKTLLRQIDVDASKRVTAYAANSTTVARRIKAVWGRDALVIHPPVRVEFYSEPSFRQPTRDYILGVGRWIPYKQLHLVIEIADILGMPVKIAGRGPDKSRIVGAAKAARVPVELIEAPSDTTLRELYRNAACLVFPTVEDFGMVPVEAQAAGTPVVALRAGGALDTIWEGKSGFFAGTAEPDAIAHLVAKVGRLSSTDCRQSASRFSGAMFRTRMAEWVAAQLIDRSLDSILGPDGPQLS